MSAPFSAFLLAGGSSRRMGSDKALLLVSPAKTLIERQLDLLRSLTPTVSVLAPPERYPHLPVPVLPDLRPNAGPLAGIEAALAHTSTNWNLILAVDHAGVNSKWLAKLRDFALSSQFLCVASAAATDNPSPLCAFWHKSALPAVAHALTTGNRRVRDVLASLPHHLLIPEAPEILSNWNRPEEIRPLDPAP